VQIANLTQEGMIRLPWEITKTFRQGGDFIVATYGDTIILNPVKIPDVTKIAERLPDLKGEMSLEEISDEIHQYRQEKRRKK